MSALLDPRPAEHSFYARRGIAGRAPLAWPGGARLALAVMVSVETYEMAPPPGSFQPATIPGGFGRGPWPDLRSWSQREYGSRVGVFRLLELLARHGVPVTPAVDRLSVERCPEIVEALQPWRRAVVAHGEAVTRVVSHRMAPDAEAAMIEGCAAALEAAFGQRPQGWHGAEYGASAHTPSLLAAAGFRQLLDWPNDEQPYRMTTPNGALVAVPVAIDHDDAYAQGQRGLTVARWAAGVLAAARHMAAEGGRCLVLNLHPWLSGQPHRVSHLDALLTALRDVEGLWFTDTSGIAAHCPEESPA